MTIKLTALKKQLLEQFLDIISADLMNEPVITPDGQTFDLSTIPECTSPLLEAFRCPTTREEYLDPSIVRPNKLYTQLRNELEKSNPNPEKLDKLIRNKNNEYFIYPIVNSAGETEEGDSRKRYKNLFLQSIQEKIQVYIQALIEAKSNEVTTQEEVQDTTIDKALEVQTNVSQIIAQLNQCTEKQAYLTCLQTLLPSIPNKERVILIKQLLKDADTHLLGQYTDISHQLFKPQFLSLFTNRQHHETKSMVTAIAMLMSGVSQLDLAHQLAMPYKVIIFNENKSYLIRYHLDVFNKHYRDPANRYTEKPDNTQDMTSTTTLTLTSSF